MRLHHAVVVLMLGGGLQGCEDIDDTVIEKYSSGRRKAQGGVKNGQKHGTWIEWDTSGRRKHEGPYRHGQKHGWWVETYNGKKWAELHYDNGRLLAKRVYDHSKKEKKEYEASKRDHKARGWQAPIVRAASNLGGLALNLLAVASFVFFYLWLTMGSGASGWRETAQRWAPKVATALVPGIGSAAFGMGLVGVLSKGDAGGVWFGAAAGVGLLLGLGAGTATLRFGSSVTRQASLWGGVGLYVMGALLFTAF